MKKSRLKEEDTLIKANNLIKSLKPYLEIPKKEKETQQKIRLVFKLKEYLSKFKESISKAQGYLVEAEKAFKLKNLKESNANAKKAYKLAKKARRYALKIDKTKQKIEGTYISPFRKYWTPKDILLSILFLFTLFILVILTSPAKLIINGMFGIFYRYFGRFETAMFFVIGFVIFSICFLIGFVIWAMNFFKGKPTKWWLTTTILLMVFIGVTGIFFVHMYIGEDNLSWLVRDSSMNQVGMINCTGSSDIIFAQDNVKCKMEPQLKNLSASVTFFFKDKTNYSMNFTDLLFVAPSEVKYVSFSFSGIDNSGNLVNLSTGNSYQFYTQEEFNALKVKFLAYLAVILSIIFITVPTVMNQLKNLHQYDKQRIVKVKQNLELKNE